MYIILYLNKTIFNYTYICNNKSVTLIIKENRNKNIIQVLLTTSKLESYTNNLQTLPHRLVYQKFTITRPQSLHLLLYEPYHVNSFIVSFYQYHTHIHTHTYIYIYICVCVSVCVITYICKYMRIYTHTSVDTRKDMTGLYPIRLDLLMQIFLNKLLFFMIAPIQTWVNISHCLYEKQAPGPRKSHLKTCTRIRIPTHTHTHIYILFVINIYVSVGV